jgi:hypothetical protein
MGVFQRPARKWERLKVMESEELIKLMQEVDAKGISWDKVEAATKVSHAILKLYANSGPVPVTILNKLKKFLESQPQ